MRLFHVSENGNIETFKPRKPYREDMQDSPALVWAITEKCLPNFLTPRDCPRVTYHVGEATKEEDLKYFSTESKHVVAIESRWFKKMQETTLYLYEFETTNFSLQDACAGYYVSEYEEKPIGKYEIHDLFDELIKRHVEVRILDDLGMLRDNIIQSSLNYSMCRMGYAKLKKWTQVDKNTFELTLEDQVLGKGYLYDFRASAILNEERMNYFIDVEGESDAIKYEIVNRLILESKKLRIEKYSDLAGRVYHCCFADHQEKIDFFNQVVGFNQDEGMKILKIKHENRSLLFEHPYEIKYDYLNDENQKNKFIKAHGKIFRQSQYTNASLAEIMEKESFKAITVLDGDEIVGNILLFVENNQGVYEDLIVCEAYRKKGIGKLLLAEANDYFVGKNISESILEVWDANNRAVSLYYSVGFELSHETETSIGMSI